MSYSITFQRNIICIMSYSIAFQRNIIFHCIAFHCIPVLYHIIMWLAFFGMVVQVLFIFRKTRMHTLMLYRGDRSFIPENYSPTNVNKLVSILPEVNYAYNTLTLDKTSHYPPGNHHMLATSKNSLLQIITTC